VLPLTVATEEKYETGAGRVHAFIPSRSMDVFVNATIEPGTVALGLRQISGDAAPGYWTEKGSSGAPVFVNGGMQLAGILRLSETGNPPVRQAFILPGSTLRRHLERLQTAAVAAGMGVSLETLQQAIPGLDLKGVDVAEIPRRLAEAVAAITAKAAEAPDVSKAGSDIDAARAKAAAKLGDMDTDGALGVWDDLLVQEKDELEALTRRRVAMLAEKASIHRLRLEHSAALVTLREIIRFEPDAFECWREIGDIEFFAGTVVDAQAAYQSALEASQRAGDEREVSRILNCIGIVCGANNDLEGALKAYEEGLEIRRRLMATDPSHAEDARDVSLSLDNVGDVHRARNDLERALKAYEEGLEIRRRLMSSDPSDAERARDVSVSLDRIGIVHGAHNDLEGALKAYEEGLEIRRRLMASDSSDAGPAGDVFLSLARIGVAELGQGNKLAACARFRDALAIIKPQAERTPDNYVLLQSLALIEILIAETGCPA
jgi:tetratricopeptide (TPR) repeat protein